LICSQDVLVQDPCENRPRIIKRAEFEGNWTGRVVLMARRASIGDLARRFDVTWFLQAMHKYRRLLAEVLLASFFLQLFALVTPLFFQVVTDKVLTHRGFTTLDVLVVGLIAVSIFETVLGALRTYVFSHTTNRIDVELGARLFRHLIALPIAYFEARRAGDSVARVRELENIRNFLTSSALTLVIDLGFTFVFLAVMFYYSPLLSWIVIGSFPFYIALSAGVTPVFRRRLENIECRPEIAPLIAQMKVADQIVILGSVLPGTDFHCYICSLPGLFTPDVASVPPCPYLPAPRDCPIEMQNLFNRAGRNLKVGIVWSGSVTFGRNHRRARSLFNFFQAFALPGVQLYSLQKGSPEEELRALPRGGPIIDLGPHLTNFAITAAALERLDLIIMTDSAVAHLAGAIGKPVWVLLGQNARWLWLSDRTTVPGIRRCGYSVLAQKAIGTMCSMRPRPS
jgi:ABC transporter transmembrane region